MILKIKNYFSHILQNQYKIIQSLHHNNSLERENLWANIYHDSIKSKPFLENLPLNIGRWAGGYAFFYVLNRIMIDYQPKKIIEFGLGESTKFISTFLDHYGSAEEHLVIEHDANWKDLFNKKFRTNAVSKIVTLSLYQDQVHSFPVNRYHNLENEVEGKFNLYIVDGPIGSTRFSRYDIITLAKRLNQDDDFIIMFDDCERTGEQDTLKELLDTLTKNGVTHYTRNYLGDKTLTLIASKQNKYFTSL